VAICHHFFAKDFEMELYFAPMSCSLATRITLYEAGIEADFHQVELATKRTKAGVDYLTVNPKGQVPALRTDSGTIITEGPAVLQYVADLKPESGLAPPAGSPDRTTLHIWLNYISTEIHKAVFYAMFNPATPPEMKAFARASLPAKYDYLSNHLAARSFLVGDKFTVADAYLVTTLGWAMAARIDLSPWPILTSYRDSIMQRPAVGRAFAEEAELR
jgi:glutathione S-transferase